VERTRTRIATDLHDDIGANLTRIVLLSEVGPIRKIRSTPSKEASGPPLIAVILHVIRARWTLNKFLLGLPLS